MEKNVIKRITRTLATASQIIIAAPVRLPPQVVVVAKYVSLGIALLEALDREEEGIRAKNLSPPSKSRHGYKGSGGPRR